MASHSKRNGSLKPASDLLQSLLTNGKSPLADQFQRWRLWREWSDVVGPTLSAHSIPVQLCHGTLYIWVESSAWLQQLSFLSEPMRDKINKYYQQKWIKQVRFTLDRKSVPQINESDFVSKIDLTLKPR